MPKIYDFVEPEVDEEGNPSPFSEMNIKMASINARYAAEKMGLTNGDTSLSDAVTECFMNPKKQMK